MADDLNCWHAESKTPLRTMWQTPFGVDCGRSLWRVTRLKMCSNDCGGALQHHLAESWRERT